MSDILGQGAEAIVRKTGPDTVVKDRIAKAYRHPAIDNALRKARTKREARIFEKLASLGFPAPRLRRVDEQQMSISMELVHGVKLRDVLHTDHIALAREIGRKVGILHANNIIHGDLTTSNMILGTTAQDKGGNEIHFIDFGLASISAKVEDKAVDLHLLDQAIESRHHDLHDECMLAVLEGYKETNPGWQAVLERLQHVQKRGRNKK